MIENKILQHLLQDSFNFSKLISRKIETKFFLNENNQILFNILFNFYIKYNDIPNDDEIASIIKTYKTQVINTENVLAAYFEIKALKDNSNFEHLMDNLIEAYKLYILKDNVLEIAKNIEHNNSVNAINLLKDSLFKIGNIDQSKFEEEISVSADARLKRYEDAKLPDMRHSVLTGFKTLDMVTGGAQDGELWVIEGWLKAGKSMFLLNVGYNAWRMGKNILYISGELIETKITRRFDALYSGVPYNSLKFGALTKDEEKHYKDLIYEKESMKNKFKVVYEPGLTTLSVHQSIKDMKYSGKIDLVIVDYLGACFPMKKSSNLPEMMGNVAYELRNIAGVERIPIITAHQRNRHGKLSGDKLGAEYTSDSIKIPQICDLYMAIKVINEEEKKNSMRYDLHAVMLASRDSECRDFICECYSDRMLIKEKSKFGI